MTAGRFDPPADLALVLALHGWKPSTFDEKFLEECMAAMEPEYRLNAIWTEAVARYGGYRLRENGSQDWRARTAVVIDPTEWTGMNDDFAGFSEAVGDYMIPLAIVGNDKLPFAIGESGAGYLIGSSILRWPRYIDGIESLVFMRSDGLVAG